MDDPYQSLLKHQYRQVSKMFSEEQVDRLIELVHQNENRLFPNSFNKPNRSTSRKTWSTICHVFNSEFPDDKKTPEQIRVKWKNMRQKARESGQLHLLTTKPMFPRRQDGSDFNYVSMNEEDASLDNSNDFNSSLANVLNAFSNTPTINDEDDRSFGLKTEREGSILSLSSEPNSEPVFNRPNLNVNEARCISVEPSSSQVNEQPMATRPKVQVPIVTAGRPIILETTNNKRGVDDDDFQQSWSNLTKRRRTIIDEVDEMKRDLLAEELKNAKKIGLVLDETLGFLKKLNQSSNLFDKINGFVNGH